jgi:sulfide:quinone oxidoreductase
VHRVVVAGAGVAALEGALALRALAEERVELVLLAPDERFVYRPMAVAEPFGLGVPYEVAVAEIAAEAGARLVPDRLASVEPEHRRVLTVAGERIEYDSLLIACGAEARPGLEGAYTFGPGAERQVLPVLLQELDRRLAQSVAFALPSGPVWALPLYELALLTARHVAEHALARVELTLVTPEEAPLGVFGHEATIAVSGLLADSGIALETGRYPVSFDQGVLRLAPEGALEVERVVSLPRLAGRRVEGVPQTADRFVWTDPHGCVIGLHDVYAAGDITAFPVKQGGIAADQALAAAEHIAAAAGAPVEPRPFDPVLHGLLLTGSTPRFLRAGIAGGHGAASEVATDALWWPPAKISGHYLPHVLARRDLVR